MTQQITHEEMKQRIINSLETRHLKYFRLKQIENEKDIEVIYNLYLYNKKVYDSSLLSITGLYYYGLYFEFIDDIQAREVCEEYYLKAIEMGDIDSMFCLANIYFNEKKNYHLVEKYLKIGSEKGDTKAMGLLASFYIDKHMFELGEKYYLMAIKKGDIKEIEEYIFYKIEQKEYDIVKKYSLNLIRKGNNKWRWKLSNVFYENQLIVDEFLKYEDKCELLEKTNEELVRKVKELEEQNKKLQTELECIPGYGSLYFKAKEDFETKQK